MAGKPQKIKRKRMSTPRVPFTRGPKRFRQLFMNELMRSNNILRALEKAQISWATYQEWLSSGFITQDDIDMAASTFHSKHPNVDSLPRRKDDDIPIGGLPIEAHYEVKVVHTHSPGVYIGEGVYELLRGYNEQEVMQPDGWIDVDGYESDE